MRTAVRTRASRRGTAAPPQLDPVESARVAGLRYVNDETMPGIRRVGQKLRVRFVLPNGRTLADPAELQRIRSLVIPPAWTDVWICPIAHGHLQATGRDARGRKQYRYHPRWREVRDEVKYGRLIAFAEALPSIRRRTDEDLNRPGLPREKVLAAVVQLLEKTLIRVGNEEYARQNGSIGLTTMKDAHARIAGGRVHFSIQRQEWRGTRNRSRRPAPRKNRQGVPRSPGYELFQYKDDDGTDADDRLGGRECVSASDQRTGLHGEGLSNVGGHGARSSGARGSEALLVQCAGEAERGERDRVGREATGKYEGGLPQVLHPSCNSGCLHGWRDDPHNRGTSEAE